MEPKELIKKIEWIQSCLDFYKWKPEILKTLEGMSKKKKGGGD